MPRRALLLLTLGLGVPLAGCAPERPVVYAPPPAPPPAWGYSYGPGVPPPLQTTPGGWTAPCTAATDPARPEPCPGAPGNPNMWVAPPGYYVAGVTWVPVPMAAAPCQPCGETRTVTTTRVETVPARRVIRRAPPHVVRDKRVKEKRIRE